MTWLGGKGIWPPEPSKSRQFLCKIEHTHPDMNAAQAAMRKESPPIADGLPRNSELRARTG
jgi:hypothetical protein